VYRIARPSLQAVQIWLEDLEAGFNPHHGWSNATSDTSLLSHNDGWGFQGSDGVRGLLYHVFTLKLGAGKHPAAAKRIHTDSKDIITEANGIEVKIDKEENPGTSLLLKLMLDAYFRPMVFGRGI